MKNILKVLYVSGMVVLSCQSDRKEARERDQEIPEVRTPEVTAEDPGSPGLPFETEINAETGETHLAHKDSTRTTPQQIVEAANIKYPQIRLILVRVKRPTVFVRIKDAAYLSQQMGSAGAESYLAEVTYSLTSVKGITSVNFDFPAGDHASPGTYTREDFPNLLKK
jgi:hypothetical protein